jgi:hypothetical protein
MPNLDKKEPKLQNCVSEHLCQSEKDTGYWMLDAG